MDPVNLMVDVSEASGLGETAAVAITVHLPNPALLPDRPVACFAKAGAGFSRGYFTCALPGLAAPSQAEWHARRGWIFVSVDHLGTGQSTQHDPERLTYPTLAAASHAAEAQVVAWLASGSIQDGFPSVIEPVRIGIGQSMGGCLTVVQEGRHHDYDGIAVLGFSAVHVQSPTPPGYAAIVPTWRAREISPDGSHTVLNQSQVAAARRSGGSAGIALTGRTESATHWTYYWDELAPEHLWPRGDGPDSEGHPPPWGSATIPGVRSSILTPGLIASEAAAVDVPVLAAMGERDIVVDPKGEPRAYISSPAVDVFICPRMGHMHNFAATRELLWQRLATWGAWVTQWAETERKG